MAIKPEYLEDGNLHHYFWNVDGGKNNKPVKSGGLKCHKCKKLIPPTEMFCIPCFGQEAPKKPSPIKVKPDDGGLLDGVPPLR
jgi:uncharacterized OB-fold protein